MNGPGRDVPILARRLLERLLGEDAEPVIGDLREVGAQRGASGWWYWRQALVAAWLLRGSAAPVAPRIEGDSRMQTFFSDLRVAARGLRQAPGFALVTVTTLALGIGATAAIFSVVRPVLLAPLPFPEPNRLVLVWEKDESRQQSNTTFATITDLQRMNRTLESVVPLAFWSPTIDGTSGDAEVVMGQRVGWDYFQTLGVLPALGRAFSAAEDTPDRRFVVVLSDGLWRRRFGADAGIIGKTISLDGRSFTVVGVMPRGFENVTTPEAQLWRPLGYVLGGDSACRTCRHLRALARLRAGVSLEAANSELNRISAELVQAYPAQYPAAGMTAVRLQDDITREARPILLVVFGAVGFLLLAACANVAHLLLARAMRRERELAVRVALGASRWRLAGQFLAESAVLAVTGGGLAVAVAAGGVKAFVALGPAGLPRLSMIHLDLAALGVTAAIALGTALVLSLVPTLALAREDLYGVVRAGTRIAGGRRHAARAGLVTLEVALAIMLLTGAGLLGRSLMRLLDAPLGLEPRGLLTVDIQTGGMRYDSVRPVVRFYESVRAEVRALPGVTAADVSSQLPLGGSFDCSGVRVQDRPLANPELAPCAQRYSVSAGWLGTMGIALVKGRSFTEDDGIDAPKVAIVSASLARRIWGDEDPIGKQIAIGRPDSPWRTVVGVAADVAHTGLDDHGGLGLYLPHGQRGYADNAMTLAVRTTGDPAALGASVRAAVARIDGTQPLGRIATMEVLVSASAARRRFALLVFVAFGAVALLLAAAGIGGMLAGVVAERTREIGIRSALGAAPGRIAGLVLGQAGALVLAGAVLGLSGAMALSRFLATLLYEVKPADLPTLALVVMVLAIVAIAACLVPLRRALGINPVEAISRD